MKARLADLLCCPECGGGLTLSPARRSGDEVVEGSLACGCGRRYPVTRGVPRFVPGDAYVSSFSFEWTRHARTQIDDAASQESYATFLQKTGLGEGDLRGRTVLDAGCGAGRFMDVVRRLGGECVGVDLSFAVDACHDNLGAAPGMHVIQADLLRLPLRPGSFDVIYSLGVLHHSEDTRRTFLRLPPLLKPGGLIAVWVYEAYAPGQRLNRLYRAVTTRLPHAMLYALCALAGPLYYLKRIPVLGRLLHLAVPTSEHPRWRWRVLDTFDWYAPRYQWRHRYPEVAAWFREAGLEITGILEPPVALQGRRPAADGRGRAAEARERVAGARERA
jgi:SAM-dependent methyltransferase